MPSAALVWRALRTASRMNAGKNLQDRTRRRVKETKGMGPPDPIVRVRMRVGNSEVTGRKP
jgi:hypothetical protein